VAIARRLSLAASAGLATLALAMRAHAADPQPAWSAWTASPVAADSATLLPIEQDALARCGMAESGLREPARAVVAGWARGATMPDASELAVLERAAGEPHPWARAWLASARGLDRDATLRKLDAWLGGKAARPLLRRCGVAWGQGREGEAALAVVVVDALADLDPVPTRARPGQWLTLRGHLRVPASASEVVVLGPTGLPRVVPSTFDGRSVVARFVPDRPGMFTLQVMADVAGGPRPVLEATVFAGVDPAATDATSTAPGEAATDTAFSDAENLGRMVSAARASVGLPPLSPDASLNRVAGDHAAHMAAAGRLAHDVGDGDPVERLRVAGVDAHEVGENAAHGATLALAHRATWGSPSHRANLLAARFTKVGVGVARDADGGYWIVETFTGR
jgi:uncharacterized protein YkwD